MCGLGKLTEQQIHQAFLKVKAEVTLENGKLIRVTDDIYGRALDFLRDYFVTDEPLHKLTGAKWSDTDKNIHMDTLRQNLSVMIVDEANGEIMALLTINVVHKDQCSGEGGIENDKTGIGWTFVLRCEKEANIFEHFGVQKAVHLDCLVTSPKYRRRGLGRKLVEASLMMVRHFGVDKLCVKAEGSSLFTQKMFERAGMQCLYKCMYGEYEVDGRTVFDVTGVHDSMKIYGMMVESPIDYM